MRLTLTRVPKRLLVVGAGVIGLELGSVWRRLGAEVQVVEFLDRILPGMDLDVAKSFQRILSKQGFTFQLGAKVTRSKAMPAATRSASSPPAGGAAETLDADVVLVAIGRVPVPTGWASKKPASSSTSAAASRSTRISRPTCPASTRSATSIGGPMLAHKAEDEGVAVAEIMAGQAGHVNYDVIPAVIYTHPEVASVGLTEEELKAAGIAYKVGKFPFIANGRAKVMRPPRAS